LMCSYHQFKCKACHARQAREARRA
jgi:hypothetical protein